MQGDILTERKKKLRDAIESQKTLLIYEESQEILNDLANQAVIDLSDEFRKLEFTTKDLDDQVDALIRFYSEPHRALLNSYKN